MPIGQGTPRDWTNGTGVFPSGGSIVIPANTERQEFFVENRDIGIVRVAYAMTAANGSGADAEVVSLSPAATSGGQGGSDERSASSNYVPMGSITVTGTAGQQVSIFEG